MKGDTHTHTHTLNILTMYDRITPSSICRHVTFFFYFHTFFSCIFRCEYTYIVLIQNQEPTSSKTKDKTWLARSVQSHTHTHTLWTIKWIFKRSGKKRIRDWYEVSLPMDFICFIRDHVWDNWRNLVCRCMCLYVYACVCICAKKSK